MSSSFATSLSQFQSRKLASALCITFFAAGAAFGQSQGYSYSFSGAGISGSGDVYLSAGTTNNAYTVESITGQVNGIQITGLLPTGTFNNNDNLFYDNLYGEDIYLDDSGVGFSLADGADAAIYLNYSAEDYYFAGDGNFTLDNGNPPQPDVQPSVQSFSRFHSFAQVTPPETSVALDTFSFAPLSTSATPEPSSFLLLGTGAATLAGIIRRRR